MAEQARDARPGQGEYGKGQGRVGGRCSLADRHKMIQLADLSDNDWGTVAQDKGYKFADEEDNKKMGTVTICPK